MAKSKTRIFSGIQPSGLLHLGNYLGAIKQWVELQDQVDEAIFCVVDLHAITVPQDPKELKKNIMSVAATYLAAGIDPKKSSIFVQSSRPEHAELAWVLNCNTTLGQLDRMTQFKLKTGVIDYDNIKQALLEALEGDTSDVIKNELTRSLNDLPEREYSKTEITEIANRLMLLVEKAGREATVDTIIHHLEKFYFTPRKESGMGLYDYPVLMAADILLYQATHVPVGEDQKQHVELTRDLAERFNNRYSETFVIPRPVIRTSSARIMGLDDPTKKMSKSAASPNNFIALTDSPDTIRTKLKKAVTDSGSEIKAGPDKPALTNLLNIYSEVSGKSVKKIEQEYSGKGYGQFKEGLAEAIIEYLTPFHKKYAELIGDDDKIVRILRDGAEKISPLAKTTLQTVKSKIGLGI